MDYLLNDTNVTAMTTANGAPPATRSALAVNPLYKKGGPLQLFADQFAKPCGDSDITKTCVAVPRPVTAGYPTITAKFSEALNSVYGGADPKSALAKAARAIDQGLTRTALRRFLDYTVLSVLAFLFALPVSYLFMGSLKPSDEVLKTRNCGR